jgi:hypothetical protein
MSNDTVDLANIFQAVTQTLAEQKQSLNQADNLNRDHGDNMVKTFETITQSLQAKKGKPASTALNYAAKQVSKKATSGSGKLYSQGLTQAAGQVKGKQIDSQAAVQLLQTLIGGGQAQPAQQQAGGDMLSSLLGGLMGGTQQQEQQSQPEQPAGGDMLSSLLGGLMSGSEQQQQQQPAQQASENPLASILGGLAGGETTQSQAENKIDAGDLLSAGLAYLQAKQSGSSTAQAAVQALAAASGMGTTQHRQQSTQLVISSFLQALSSMKR